MEKYTTPIAELIYVKTVDVIMSSDGLSEDELDRVPTGNK